MTIVGYIGGLGRSGSTLLERIAACFDGVVVLGEVVHAWERGVRDDELCGCGQRFSRCPFWQEVGQVAFGGWRLSDADDMRRLRSAIDRTRHIPRLVCGRASTTFAADLREYGERFAAIYQAAAQVRNATVVIDSSKHASTALVLRRTAELDLRVVHMVRDSRGVAYSWTKRMHRPEAHEGSDIELMHRYEPWRAALIWNTQNAAFAALARTAIPVWRLYYEQLLDDPVQTVEQLAEFFDIRGQSVRDFVSATEVRVGPTHQIAGNPSRFHSGTVPLRRDDEWRHALPSGDRHIVTALTAPLMARYGYLVGSRRRRQQRR